MNFSELMIQYFSQFLNLLGSFLKLIGTVSLTLFVIYFLFPEKFERIIIMINKVLAYLSEKHERKYISRQIEYSIERKRRELDRSGVSNILPYGIKIEWTNVDDPDFSLKENMLIVKMKNHRNQSKNLAIATKIYVNNALIPKARRYVEPILMKSIDFIISKHILSWDTAAITHFLKLEEVNIRKNPELKMTIEHLDKIDGVGYITRILLREYDKLSALFPREPEKKFLRKQQN